MKSKVIIIMMICICTMFLFGCKNENVIKYEIIREPMWSAGNEEISRLYGESGLRLDDVKHNEYSESINTVKTIEYNGKEYSAEYAYTVSPDTENNEYLEESEYDRYIKDGLWIEYYKKSGRFKSVSVSNEMVSTAEPILQDFSEKSLKKAAMNMLNKYYGKDINKYIDSYYVFEDAKFLELSNRRSENSYTVTYRAYIKDVPTNDEIVVYFSPDGVFQAIVIKNHLQYIDYDTTGLISTGDIEKEMKKYMKKLGYESCYIDEKNKGYYKMSNKGDLYYEVNYFGNSEKQEYMCGEVLAVKAKNTGK